jgi:hypothetical protein
MKKFLICILFALAMLVSWRREGSLWICTYDYLGTRFEVIMSDFCPSSYEI